MNKDALTYRLIPESKAFSLESLQFDGATLEAGFALAGRAGDTHLALSDASWETEELTGPNFADLPFEIQHGVEISLTTTIPGVSARVYAALLSGRPLLALKMAVYNGSSTPLTMDRLTLMQMKPGGLSLQGRQPLQPAFYSQGWQSWSASGAYKKGDRQQKSMLERFQVPMIFNPGTPRPREKNRFSGDMFGLLGDLDSRIGLVSGLLSQKKHFGSLEACFEPALSISLWANGDGTRLETGAVMETDWAACGFVAVDDPDPLDPYISAVAAVNAINAETPIPVGWCSWYHFYSDINQDVIQSNMAAVVELQPEIPLPLFQIDDGFEPYAGDWFDFVPGFPDGLAPLTEKAKEQGLIPGLWLAPFIVHPKAKLVKEHPEWLLRDKKGRRVTAGFVWNRFTFALDLTHPETLAYAKEVIRAAVEKWGFDYLKLDFLYAAALDGQYQDPTLTRAQVMRMGLEALREAAGPKVTLLGCGCPLGSALGLFQVMRISADVSGFWAPHFPPVSRILRNEPNIPSARNAVQNILSRAFLHRQWWVNDPDCLLVRPETDLSLAEVQTLATAISLTGGSLLLSDDLPTLPEARLRLAQILLPLIGQRPRVIDWLDRYTPSVLRLDLDGPSGPWHLLAHFNWDESDAGLAFSPRAFHLPGDGTWWVREFWTGQIGQISNTTPLILEDVPPHGVRVLAARPYMPERPMYIGSDLHLSQGREVNTWHQGHDEIRFSLDVGHQASGKILLHLPRSPLCAWIGGQPQTLQALGQGIHAIHLDEANNLEIKVKY